MFWWMDVQMVCCEGRDKWEGRLLVGLLRKVGEMCFLYVLFVADLHSGLLCCIFAVAREVRGRFPFLDSHLPNGPPTP